MSTEIKMLRTVGTVVGGLEELSSKLKLGTRFDRSQYAQLTKTAGEILEKIGSNWSAGDFFLESELTLIINRLKNLDPEIPVTELLTEKIAPESKLDKLTLDELVAEYEKSKGDKKIEIARSIERRAGVKNVDRFISRLKELRKNVVEELAPRAREATIERAVEEETVNELLEEQVGEEVVSQAKVIAKKAARDLEKSKEVTLPRKEMAVEIEKEIIKVVEGKEDKVVIPGVDGKNLVWEKIQKQAETLKSESEEKTRRVMETAVERVEGKISGEESKERIGKLLGRNKDLARRMVVKTEAAVLKAETEVMAEEVATVLVDKLEDEGEILPAETKPEIKRQVVEMVLGERDIEGGIEIPMAEEGPALREAAVKVKNFVLKNKEGVTMLRLEGLKQEIGVEMTAVGVGHEDIIEFQRITEEFYFHERAVDLSEYKGQAEDFVRARGRVTSAGKIENAWHETQAIASAVTNSPKEFNRWVEKYQKLREIIGVDKLPDIKKIQAMDRVVEVFIERPEMLKLLNLAQKYVEVREKISGVGYTIIRKLGIDDTGLGVVRAIGGVAAVDFVVNGMAVLAEKGTLQGLGAILQGVMGGEIVLEGAAGVEGITALSSTVAAFGSIPVAGQVVLVVVMVVMLVKVVWDIVIAPIIKFGKKIVEKLGFDPDWVQRATQSLLGNNAFGRFAGKVGQFGHDVLLYLVIIPEFFKRIFKMVNLAAFMAPAAIGLIIFMVIINGMNNNVVSSLVPPKGGGANCVLKVPGSTYSGSYMYEYTDSDGNTWVCNGAMDAGGTGPDLPGLGGEPVAGDCTVATKAVETKQCASPWGSVGLPSGCTVCNAGCGPTCVSMLWRTSNGGMTPDRVIHDPGSAYAGMGCDGSTMLQAAQELRKIYGSNVEYEASTQACDPETIGKWICAGKMVMVLAQFYRNSALETGGHFVLAVAVKGGDIFTKDPYYSVTTPFDGKREVGHIHSIMECMTIDVGLD